MVFFPNQAAGDALQTVDQSRNGYLGGIIDQQMYMVLLAVKLHQLSFKVAADGSQNRTQVVQDGFGKHTTTIFCDKDQMNVKAKHTMSSGSNII